MKKNSMWVLVVLILLAAKVSRADSYVAVSASGEDAVNLYKVGPLGIFQVTKSIPVGKKPGEMCLDPNGKRLFVSVAGDKKVAVIDLGTQSVVGNLTDAAIQSPDGCAVSPDSKKLYVLDTKANKAFVFSTSSNQLLKQIAVGEEPRRALFSPDGRKLFVSNADSNTLSVIDPSSDTVVSTIKTGHEPRVLTYSPDGKFLVVSLINDDSLQYFKADTLELEDQSGAVRSIQRVSFSPDGKLIYVLGAYDGVVGVVDLRYGDERRMGATIPLPHHCYGMAMTPDGKWLFASSSGDNSISMIDVRLMKVASNLSNTKGPGAMVYIP